MRSLATTIFCLLIASFLASLLCDHAGCIQVGSATEPAAVVTVATSTPINCPVDVPVSVQPGAIALSATLACSRPLVDLEPGAVGLSLPMRVAANAVHVEPAAVSVAPALQTLLPSPTTQAVAVADDHRNEIIGGVAAVALIVFAVIWHGWYIRKAG